MEVKEESDWVLDTVILSLISMIMLGANFNSVGLAEINQTAFSMVRPVKLIRIGNVSENIDKQLVAPNKFQLFSRQRVPDGMKKWKFISREKYTIFDRNRLHDYLGPTEKFINWHVRTQVHSCSASKMKSGCLANVQHDGGDHNWLPYLEHWRLHWFPSNPRAFRSSESFIHDIGLSRHDVPLQQRREEQRYCEQSNNVVWSHLERCEGPFTILGFILAVCPPFIVGGAWFIGFHSKPFYLVTFIALFGACPIGLSMINGFLPWHLHIEMARSFVQQFHDLISRQ